MLLADHLKIMEDLKGWTVSLFSRSSFVFHFFHSLRIVLTQKVLPIWSFSGNPKTLSPFDLVELKLKLFLLHGKHIKSQLMSF